MSFVLLCSKITFLFLNPFFFFFLFKAQRIPEIINPLFYFILPHSVGKIGYFEKTHNNLGTSDLNRRRVMPHENILCLHFTCLIFFSTCLLT